MPYKDPEAGRARRRELYRKNPALFIARVARWRELNLDLVRETERRRRGRPEVRAARRKHSKLWNARNPERRRLHSFSGEHSMTLEQAAAVLAAKPRACEICGSAAKLQYDHCHQTGEFRGWLCGPCNRMLGMARDDPQRLRAAADYIEVHVAKTAGPEHKELLEISHDSRYLQKAGSCAASTLGA